MAEVGSDDNGFERAIASIPLGSAVNGATLESCEQRTLG